jgi:hypothetical protein
MMEPRNAAEVPGCIVPRTIIVDFWIMSFRLSRCKVEAWRLREAATPAKMINLRIIISKLSYRQVVRQPRRFRVDENNRVSNQFTGIVYTFDTIPAEN